MRFKQGDRVEVLSEKEVASGSWRCGIITSGNGHNYYIRYECSTGATGAPVVDRVPRKVIRPCPPVKIVESWAAGDLVEVFDNSSWKSARILKVIGVNLFLVKILGTSQKVKAHKSHLRLPQSWQDEEWVVIQKVSGNTEGGNSDQLSTRRYHQKSLDKDSKMKHEGDDYLPVEREAGFDMSRVVSSRTLKRTSPCNLSRGARKHMRVVEIEDKHQNMVPGNYMHACIKKRESRLSGVDMESEKRNGDITYSQAGSLELNDAERSVCSVGSNGTSNKEERVEELHKLYLDAYHRTMEALHAFGFITWEQEEMMTNLRLKLRISNDEHLMKLKKLVSAQ